MVLIRLYCGSDKLAEQGKATNSTSPKTFIIEKESCCAKNLLGKHVYLQYSCTLQLLSLSSFILLRTSLNFKDASFFLIAMMLYVLCSLSCSMELENSSTSLLFGILSICCIASISSLLNNNTLSWIHVNVLFMNGWILFW